MGRENGSLPLGQIQCKFFDFSYCRHETRV
jgi:hypothetical protein